MVLRAWDTFSRHPPLFGNGSALTDMRGAAIPVYHPGPIQLWLLAGPIHWFAPSPIGALIGSAFLVSVCMAATLWAAYRHGGWPTAGLFVVLLAVLSVGVRFSNLSSPFQPWLSTFALLALVVIGWAIAQGDDWFWPAAVFFAALSAQPEVAFGIPVATTVAMIAVCRLARRRREPARHRSAPQARRRVVKITVVSVVVGLVSWSGPLYDQFFGTGNLWRMIGAGSGSDHAGPRLVGQCLITVVGGPKWIWDRTDLYGFAFGKWNEAPHWHAEVWQIVLTVVVVVVFVAGLWRSLARSDHRRSAIGLLALALVVGEGVATALLPANVGGVSHLYIWMAATIVVWWFVLVSIFDFVAAASRHFRWAVPRGLRVGLSSVAPFVASVTLVALCTVRGGPPQIYADAYFGAVRKFGDRGGQVCKEAAGPVLVENLDESQIPTTQGLVSMLLLDGCTVHVAGLRATVPGVQHRPTGDEAVTLVVTGSPVLPDGFRLLTSYPTTGKDRSEPTRYLYVRNG